MGTLIELNSIELDCGCWMVVSGGWMFGGEWKKRRFLSLSLSFSVG